MIVLPCSAVRITMARQTMKGCCLVHISARQALAQPFGAPWPGKLQAHIRPQIEGQSLFLLTKPVLHAPGFAARGQHFQVQTATV